MVKLDKHEIAIIEQHLKGQVGNKYHDLHGLLETILQIYPDMDETKAKSWNADLCGRVSKSIEDPLDQRIKLISAGYELARIKSRGQSLAYLAI